jgi:hypothetical protein
MANFSIGRGRNPSLVILSSFQPQILKISNTASNPSPCNTPPSSPSLSQGSSQHLLSSHPARPIVPASTSRLQPCVVQRVRVVTCLSLRLIARPVSILTCRLFKDVLLINYAIANITSTTSALAFRSSCLEAGLVAQCCELANSSNSTGIVCAPVPADPPS